MPLSHICIAPEKFPPRREKEAPEDESGLDGFLSLSKETLNYNLWTFHNCVREIIPSIGEDKKLTKYGIIGKICLTGLREMPSIGHRMMIKIF